MNVRRLLFIINPGSGIWSPNHIPNLVNERFPKTEFTCDIRFTTARGDAETWSRQAVSDNYDAVIVAGGDGTVNECAAGLVHKNTAIGIIPTGSGNGFARHVGIPPRAAAKALDIVRRFNVQQVDTATLNGRLFLSNAGCGFIANVATAFARGKSKRMRGFTGYTWFTLREYAAFKETFVRITADGVDYSGDYFAVNICNTNQFGYNARVAPAADVKDGLLELVLIEKQAKWKYPLMLLPLFTGSFHKVRGIKTICCKPIELLAHETAQFQIDGDPVELNGLVTAEVQAGSLKLLVP